MTVTTGATKAHSDELSAVSTACSHGDQKALISAIQGVSPLCLNGQTSSNDPLIMAAKFADGHHGTPKLLRRVASKLIETLLIAGANAEGCRKELLEVVIYTGNEEALRLLTSRIDFDRRERFFAAMHALHFGRPELLELFRTIGWDPDERDRASRTPLMAACAGSVLKESARERPFRTEHIEARQFLDTVVKANVNINAADQFSATPIMYAAMAKRWDIVHGLLECGSNANDRLPNGVTIAHLCLAGAPVELVRYIIKASGDPSFLRANVTPFQPATRALVQETNRANSKSKSEVAAILQD